MNYDESHMGPPWLYGTKSLFLLKNLTDLDGSSLRIKNRRLI
ncbi:hypothetical protein LX77_00853 [Gelidibacter algens]|uniref:Uncharacterized protein n=1 Tax=Gelidibacter algens TaxID=49280 RepID=A0A327SBZ8_9FLAO|nr:hypothetical protein LX77_00853 [Gelidibacter algens]